MEYDEDAVVCDMAETYGIFDMSAVPIGTYAALAVGLRDESRIKTKIRTEILKAPQYTVDQILMARMVDLLDLLLWARTKDGQKNKNRPESLLNAMLGREDKKNKEEDKPQAFDTPADFNEAWKKMGGGVIGDGTG